MTYTTEGSTVKSTGIIQWDAVAHRGMTYRSDSGETTIFLQEEDDQFIEELQTSVFTIGAEQPNPSCTCRRYEDRVVGNMWYVFAGGATNSSGCSGGSLYTNPAHVYPGRNVMHQEANICMSGSSTPVYSQIAEARITYDTFTAGRPKTWNITALESRLPACLAGCNTVSKDDPQDFLSLLHQPPKKHAPTPVKLPKVPAVGDGWPSAPSASFSAEVEFNTGGIKSGGFIEYDAEARRYVQFAAEASQTKIVIQEQPKEGVESSYVYVYNVVPTNPGTSCTCKYRASTDLSNPWYTYLGGASNSSSGDCSGSLFTNQMKGYSGRNTVPGPTSLCMNGATPVWSEEGNTRITYTSFTAGRPKAFNTTALDPHLPVCAMGC